MVDDPTPPESIVFFGGGGVGCKTQNDEIWPFWYRHQLVPGQLVPAQKLLLPVPVQKLFVSVTCAGTKIIPAGIGCEELWLLPENCEERGRKLRELFSNFAAIRGEGLLLFHPIPANKIIGADTKIIGASTKIIGVGTNWCHDKNYWCRHQLVPAQKLLVSAQKLLVPAPTDAGTKIICHQLVPAQKLLVPAPTSAGTKIIGAGTNWCRKPGKTQNGKKKNTIVRKRRRFFLRF